MIQACLPMTEVTALHPIRSHTPVPPLLTLGFSACLEVCFPTFSPQARNEPWDSGKGGPASETSPLTVLGSCG